MNKSIINIYGVANTSGDYKGFGSWGFQLLTPKASITNFGKDKDTNAVRMEMKGIIEALTYINATKHLLSGDKLVKVYTTSSLYWKTLSGEYKMKSNKDLWKQIVISLKELASSNIKVEFHQGKVENLFANEVKKRLKDMEVSKDQYDYLNNLLKQLG